MDVFSEKYVRSKINLIQRFDLDFYKTLDRKIEIPDIPARDLTIVLPEQLPIKKGLSYSEGQARLLHDLASIELQAMELAFRTLIEYRDLPVGFQESLLNLAQSESEHLELCLNGIEALGFRWGDWPAHCALWQAVSSEDSIIDRIFIVHLYLEGSGLDAGDTILRRLYGVKGHISQKIIERIIKEEIDHVKFGQAWFKYFVKNEKLDPDEVFKNQLKKLKEKLPKRIEPISHILRNKAQFSDSQIHALIKHRELSNPKSVTRSINKEVQTHLKNILQ